MKQLLVLSQSFGSIGPGVHGAEGATEIGVAGVVGPVGVEGMLPPCRRTNSAK